MKKATLWVIMAVSIMLFSASCSSGISQEIYKKATDDLSSATSQNQTLQSQLGSAQSQNQILQSQLSTSQSLTQSLQSQVASSQAQNQTLQSQLTSSQSQNQSTQTQISSLQTQNQSLQSDLKSATDKIKKAKIVADMVASIMEGTTGTLTTAEALTIYNEWTIGVKEIGDAGLTAKFDAFVSSSGSDQTSEEFLLYLFSLESKLLQ